MDRDAKQAQELPHSALDPQENSLLLTENLNRLWSSLIVDEFIRQGIDTFFTSPGMRNAPLLAAIHHHPEAKAHIGIDERAHAYHALGYSKAQGKPTVLVCTSGTAMANYLPAIIEAKETGHSLIVLSADRPPELVYSGANQTIRQDAIYSSQYALSRDLGTPTEQLPPSALRNILANLIHQAAIKKMPAHLNCPFREPLDNTRSDISSKYQQQALAPAKSPSLQYATLELNAAQLSEIQDSLKKTTHGLLVIGELSVSSNYEVVRTFAKKLGWPIFLDATSSLKYEFNLNSGAIPTLDHPEVFQYLSKNSPKTIFHIGGRLTSKYYYRFVQENPAIELILLNETIENEDPGFRVNRRYSACLSSTLEKISLNRETSSFAKELIPLVQKKTEIIDNAPLTYPVISKAIVELSIKETILYLGNSTVIRSFDSYASVDKENHLKVISHRGASGIEGFIASACGYKKSSTSPLTLVLGDISFLHDLNSLQYLKDIKGPFVIVLVNNHGGGIFNLLPIADEKAVLPYLTTPHSLSFSKAAEAFEVDYVQVQEVEEFKKAYQESQGSSQPKIIEVIVNDQENVNIYQSLKTVKL